MRSAFRGPAHQLAVRMRINNCTHGHYYSYGPSNQPCTSHAPATARTPRVCTLVPFIFQVLSASDVQYYCLAFLLKMYMFLMRDEKEEERSKQGQTNKQGKATQHTQGSHCTCCLGYVALLCLFDLACFFLPSFSSLIKTCIYIYMHACTHVHVHVHLLCCFALFVCLFDLACLLLSSFSSFMYTVHVHVHCTCI